MDQDQHEEMFDTMDAARGRKATGLTGYASASKEVQEKFSLNGKGLGWHLQLKRMDATARADVLRTFDKLRKLGALDAQGDLVDGDEEGDGELDEARAREMGLEAARAGRPDTDIEDEVYQVAALTRAWREGHASFFTEPSDDSDAGGGDAADTLEPPALASGPTDEAEPELKAEDNDADWQGDATVQPDAATLDRSGSIYTEGEKAAEDGLEKSANPHPEKSSARRLWSRGYTSKKLKLARASQPAILAQEAERARLQRDAGTVSTLQ